MFTIQSFIELNIGVTKVTNPFQHNCKKFFTAFHTVIVAELIASQMVVILFLIQSNTVVAIETIPSQQVFKKFVSASHTAIAFCLIASHTEAKNSRIDSKIGVAKYKIAVQIACKY
ncbi:Uncharacterised protein [Streptococcus pneumoniae]|nr:Uncharacterised protein [Streptococcus pneumoniae]